jgi:hypothetical protein
MTRQILKVPKREIFVTVLYTLSDPIWLGDLGLKKKIHLCIVLVKKTRAKNSHTWAPLTTAFKPLQEVVCVFIKKARTA